MQIPNFIINEDNENDSEISDIDENLWFKIFKLILIKTLLFKILIFKIYLKDFLIIEQLNSKSLSFNKYKNLIKMSDKEDSDNSEYDPETEVDGNW